MKDIIKQKKINLDIHLKNIFIRDVYLELGIIDYEVVLKLLNFELININDLTFFPVQNKGLGHSNHTDASLKNSLPYFFFYNLEKNYTNYNLCITYGLLSYLTVEKKESFMPIFIMPIKMYYEENELFVQLLYKPLINPLINSVISQSKLSFTQSLDLFDIKALDYALYTISKLPKVSVKPDNYLSYFEKTGKDIILPTTTFSSKQNSLIFDKYLFKNKFNYYFSKVLNYDQMRFIKKACLNESMTLTGFSGSGKTTVLKNIIVNNLYNDVNTLFISESNKTLNDVYEFIKQLHLESLASLLNKSFPKLLNNTYSKKLIHKEINLGDKYKQLNTFYKELDVYENYLNKSYKGFKIVEALEENFLINKDNLIEYENDSVEDIYKHEYFDILKILKTIETSSKKLGSFKSSVWNAIPTTNSIKHVNQVINIVFQLNQGLKKLRSLEISLKEFGIKNSESFSEMKKIIAPFEKMNLDLIPSSWKTSIDLFEESKYVFLELKKDISTFNEINLDNLYIDILNYNIDKAIKLLYGDYYKETDLEIIENILKNKNNINLEITKFKKYYQEYNILKIELEKIFNQNASKNYLFSLYQFLNNYNINNKLINLDNINLLDNLYNKYIDLDEKLKEFKKIIKKIKKNDPKVSLSSDYTTYLKLLSEIEDATNNYKNLTGLDINNHLNNKEIIHKIKEFMNNTTIEIKTYLESNSFSIEFLVLLNKYFGLIINIENQFNFFNNFYNIFNNQFEIDLENLSKYTLYLEKLFESNLELKDKVISNIDNYLSPTVYFDIKDRIKKHKKMLKQFESNKLYKKLFEQLYEKENTQISKISKIILMYESFVYLFVSKESVYEGIKNYQNLITLIDNINLLLVEIGESLRLYGLLFKDSVSRYYFSSIETNINYLTNLLSSKDELVSYLQITSNIKLLSKYKLFNTIKYIENNDEFNYLTNTFKYRFFLDYFEKVLDQEILKTDYFKKLDLTLKLEDEVNYFNSNRILNSIHIENDEDVIKLKKNNYKYYFKYFKNKKRLYLCNKDIALSYYKYIGYSTIIVDDAHIITSGEYASLFRNKQVIISGDYQNNKIVNQNLVSLTQTQETIILKSRYEKAPRGLSNNIAFTKTPHLVNKSSNLGVRVVEKDIEDIIFGLYAKNKNVSINYFIKDVSLQKEVYEKIAKVFYNNNIQPEKITNFLMNNLYVSCILSKTYQKSDYNILYLKDYWEEDSQIVASNIFEILVLATSELIIYDDSNILLKNSDYELFKKIKNLVNNQTIFYNIDNNLVCMKIKEEFEKRGCSLYFPGSSVNFSFSLKDSDKLFTVVILYTSYITQGILNIYRDFINQYENILFRVALDYLKGPSDFVESLIEEAIKKEEFKK